MYSLTSNPFIPDSTTKYANEAFAPVYIPAITTANVDAGTGVGASSSASGSANASSSASGSANASASGSASNITKTKEINILFEKEYFRRLLDLIKLDNDYKAVSDDDLKESIFNYAYISRNVKDRFLHENLDLLKWYETKNPNYDKLESLNYGNGPKMPEFQTLLVTIVLNLIKTLTEGKFPTRKKKPSGKKNNEEPKNETKRRSYKVYNSKFTRNNKDIQWHNLLNKLLIKISNLNYTDSSKSDYFSYKTIMEIYLTYMAYMGGINIENFGEFEICIQYKSQSREKLIYNNSIQDELGVCANYIYYVHNIFKNTPFILYPTFIQLNERVALKTLSAPVINFYITYTRSLSHDYYMPPCEHLEHDVIFHGTLTHLHLLEIFDKTRFTKFTKLLHYKNLAFNIYDDSAYEKIKNSIINFYRNIYSKFFNYVFLHAEEIIIDILFTLFHERMEYFIKIYNLHIPFTIQDFLQNIIKCKNQYLSIEQGKARAGKSSVNKSILVKTQKQENEEIRLLSVFIQKFASAEHIELEAASTGKKRTRNNNNPSRNYKWRTSSSKNYSTGNSMRGYPYTRNSSQYTRNRHQYSHKDKRNSRRYSPY